MNTLIEPKVVETKPVTPMWVEIGLQLAFNISMLYLSHVITLHMWRAMTGH
jgi:hypothetical protein